jgi:hypothetical protein
VEDYILIQIFELVRDLIEPFLVDFSNLSVFLSHFLVGTEDEDGSGVALDVVELLEKVDACEVVGLPVFNPDHVGDHLELDVHPVEQPVELAGPLQSHLRARQLHNLQLLSQQAVDCLLIVLWDIVNPYNDIFVEAHGTGHFREPDFIIVLVSIDFLHHKVGEGKEEDLLLLFVDRKQTDVLSRSRTYMEDRPVAFLELLSDFHVDAGRGEVLPVETVTLFLVGGEAEVIESPMNFTVVIG